MNDVFGDPTPQESEGVKPIDQSELQPQQPEQAEPGDAAPPAADTDKHVPLAALEAVRNDYKGKAARLEGEMAAIRAERDRLLEAQRPGQQPQQERNPILEAQSRLETVILNASERAARKEYGAETVDKAFERMRAEFAKNPALHQQVMAAADPWDEVVQQGKRLMAMDEIGADPVAYRTKLESEIRAALQQQPAQPAAPSIPQSLAGARSSGARGTSWTGQTPFDALFN